MRWLETETTAGPATEPIDRTEADEHGRIDGTASDGYVDGLIVAARRWVERYTGSRLITQTVVMRANRFCGRALRLPVAPLQSVLSLAYLDTAGDQQTLSSSLYRIQLGGLAPRIELRPGECWPETYCAADAIEITAVAGYGSAAADVPEEIRHALKILVGHFNDHRDGTAPVPPAVAMLLANYRVFEG